MDLFLKKQITLEAWLYDQQTPLQCLPAICFLRPWKQPLLTFNWYFFHNDKYICSQTWHPTLNITANVTLLKHNSDHGKRPPVASSRSMSNEKTLKWPLRPSTSCSSHPIIFLTTTFIFMLFRLLLSYNSLLMIPHHEETCQECSYLGIFAIVYNALPSGGHMPCSFMTFIFFPSCLLSAAFPDHLSKQGPSPIKSS